MEWNDKHPSAYESAYCEHSLWATLSPIVRVQLLFWDPILNSCLFTKFYEFHVQSFKEMKWFLDLNRVIDQFPQVRQLQIKLVDEEVIPKVKDIIMSPWNVFSSNQNQRISFLINDLQLHYKSMEISSKGVIDNLYIKVLDRYHSTLKKITLNSEISHIRRLIKVNINFYFVFILLIFFV